MLLAVGSVARAEVDQRFFGDPVVEIRIEGLREELAAQIRDGLELKPRSGFLTVDRAKLERAALQRDLDRVRLFLARHGHPRASVTAHTEARGDFVRLILRVDPGRAVRVGAIEVEGLPHDFPPKPGEDDLDRHDRFRDEDVRGAVRLLQDRLRQDGYAQARVERRLAFRDSTTVIVTLAVTDTQRFRFDGLEVKGASEDLRELARRSVERPDGELFSPVTLEQARRDLRELGLFRQVRVRADQSGPDTLTLVAELTRREMRSLMFGIGTWSDHPIQLRSGWEHRNLLGSGRGFEIEGSYALNLRELESKVTWPVLLRRRSVSEFGTRLQIEDENAYYSEELDVFVDHLFRIGDRASWRVGMTWSTTTLDVRTDDDTAFETRPGQQILLDARWFYDGVDDLLDPNRGRRFRLEAEWAPQFSFADATFASLRGAAAQVVSLGEDTVLAGRLDVATAWPIGRSVDLLPTQRWYGGGFNTHRGASRRGLGPTDSGGDPIGGQWRALAGVELRLQMTSWLGLDLFVDSGQVWERTEDIGTADLIVAVGAGPMIYTPIGPIHLDLAWNVAERPTDGSDLVFNFGIGHPY